MAYKWCVVQLCTNTSIKTPEKMFVSIPKNPEIRKKWLMLARRNPEDIAASTNAFMCEDHFNVSKHFYYHTFLTQITILYFIFVIIISLDYLRLVCTVQLDCIVFFEFLILCYNRKEVTRIKL